MIDFSGLIGAFGGLTLFEMGKYIYHRKANKRIIETQASTDELHLFKETIQFLQQQLQDKEVRFAEQTQLVRKLNTEVIELTKKAGMLELELERLRSKYELELKRVRCEDGACPFRLPPNAMTPSMPEMTKEQWNKIRQNLPRLLLIANENTD